MKNKISLKSSVILLMIFMLIIISTPGVIALNKPVQGFVKGVDNFNDITVVVLATVNDTDKSFECYTFPEIEVDDRGYYITDLANLKKTIDASDCSIYWDEGDKIKVIARSGENYFASAETSIPDKSGAEFNLPDIFPVDYKIEFPEAFSKNFLHIEKVTVRWENEFYVLNVVLANDAGKNYDDVSLNFNVFSSGQNIVETLSADNLQINSSQMKNVELRWDTSAFAGIYDGEINLYDGAELVDVFPIPNIFIPAKNKPMSIPLNVSLVFSVLILIIIIVIIFIIFVLYKLRRKEKSWKIQIKKIKKRKIKK